MRDSRVRPTDRGTHFLSRSDTQSSVDGRPKPLLSEDEITELMDNGMFEDDPRAGGIS